MTADYEFGIVGTGFGGLIAALKLQALGKNSFVMFERASEIGGTWRDNVYPGCACDVQSNLYSIESQPNPAWSHTFSRQPEIWQYMKNVIAKNHLAPHIRLNTAVTAAHFLEKEAVWLLRDHHGRETRVRMLLLAMGLLNRPHTPHFAGMERFRGEIVHSAEWRTDIDLRGKRVAVIGTGASAIQIVPAVAPVVKQLSVFQRTPAWIVPRFDKAVSAFRKNLFRRFPALQRFVRKRIFWANELSGYTFVHDTRLRRIPELFAQWHLKRHIKDPALRRAFTPAYELGCKRVLVSDDFYPTFNLPHVRLETLPIQEFTENGLRCEGGTEQIFDVIVLATGFIAADIDWGIEITGLQGRNLMDEWKHNGAEAYLGTTVSGFPNLALVLGPNTGGGHNSVLDTMESQMGYVAEYIRLLETQAPTAFLDLRADVQSAYNQRLQTMFHGTVWSSGCKSWYHNAQGKNTTIYPQLNKHFRNAVRVLHPADYTIRVLSSTT
ncbi:MAG: NAD(P)/FAD-dependent oxidoreductase [Candidatus Kapabacteria bacterium]|nr:NAD(P)/FAD-dependent oxidoreductase [Candidatus Kapabacteria bacterium]